MNYLEDEYFQSFTREMYMKNCDERQLYNDPVVSYEEYMADNEAWLIEVYFSSEQK